MKFAERCVKRINKNIVKNNFINNELTIIYKNKFVVYNIRMKNRTNKKESLKQKIINKLYIKNKS